jgi:hypothetical protein
MSPILFQIHAIRKLTRREWASTDDLHAAICAALKEIAAEVDMALSNRLEAEAQDAWEKGDML